MLILSVPPFPRADLGDSQGLGENIWRRNNRNDSLNGMISRQELRTGLGGVELFWVEAHLGDSLKFHYVDISCSVLAL